VFTTARGRDAVFWQSPRTRKQARPNVTTPTARAAGIASLEIVVDTREQYAYRFASQQVTTVSERCRAATTASPSTAPSSGRGRVRACSGHCHSLEHCRRLGGRA
jgi:hypothetical protein